MPKTIQSYIGHDALDKLSAYCQKKNRSRYTIITDQIEYEILGKRVEKLIRKNNWQSDVVILDGNPVQANEDYIIQVLTKLDNSKRMFLSVGSGTITDITRFVAYRTRNPFISLPTAPSMDGYAASASSLTFNGFKQTVYSCPPVAIFADLGVLCEAPRPMISSGFGDTFGKFTALADWKLAHLLWGDTYDSKIAERVAASLKRCTFLVNDLEDNWEENIHALMNALIEVGICMHLAGTTRPASGSEHSLSHFWEMKLMREGRPVGFHGTKVGFASILISRQYELLRQMSKLDAMAGIRNTSKPDIAGEQKAIRNAFGAQSEQVQAVQAKFINQTDNEFIVTQKKIVENWDEIQEIAKTVPTVMDMVILLKKVGLVTNPSKIHLNENDLKQAMQFGHFARNAFTILKLFRFLGVEPSINWQV